MEEKAKLGEILLKAGLVSDEQLKRATDMQKVVGGRLGSIIVKLGFLGEDRLIESIGKQQSLPVVNLDEIVIPISLVKRLPRTLIEKHEILPVAYSGNVLTIVTSDPFDFDALEEVQFALDCKVEINLAPRSAILRTIDEVFAKTDKLVLQAKDKKFDKSKDELLEELEEEQRVEKIKEEALSKNVVETPQIPPTYLLDALIPLLIEKDIITEEELIRKSQELGR